MPCNIKDWLRSEFGTEGSRTTLQFLALSRLPDLLRRAVFLYVEDGWGQRAVAAHLGIAQSNLSDTLNDFVSNVEQERGSMIKVRETLHNLLGAKETRSEDQQQVLASLSPKLRDPVVMYIDTHPNLSQIEIGDALGISANTLSWRLRTAASKINNLLHPHINNTEAHKRREQPMTSLKNLKGNLVKAFGIEEERTPIQEQAFRSIPPRDQEIVSRYTSFGVTISIVAHEFGLSEQVVKDILQGALAPQEPPRQKDDLVARGDKVIGIIDDLDDTATTVLGKRMTVEAASSLKDLAGTRASNGSIGSPFDILLNEDGNIIHGIPCLEAIIQGGAPRDVTIAILGFPPAQTHEEAPRITKAHTDTARMAMEIAWVWKTGRRSFHPKCYSNQLVLSWMNNFIDQVDLSVQAVRKHHFNVHPIFGALRLLVGPTHHEIYDKILEDADKARFEDCTDQRHGRPIAAHLHSIRGHGLFRTDEERFKVVKLMMLALKREGGLQVLRKRKNERFPGPPDVWIRRFPEGPPDAVSDRKR